MTTDKLGPGLLPGASRDDQDDAIPLMSLHDVSRMRLHVVEHIARDGVPDMLAMLGLDPAAVRNEFHYAHTCHARLGGAGGLQCLRTDPHHKGHVYVSESGVPDRHDRGDDE